MPSNSMPSISILRSDSVFDDDADDKTNPPYPVILIRYAAVVFGGAMAGLGGAYLALTPSCLMAGFDFAATYIGKSVSIWFDLYADVLLAWNPLHYCFDAGVSLRVRANLLVRIDFNASATLSVRGPSLYGEGKVSVFGISVTVTFDGPKTSEAAKKNPFSDYRLNVAFTNEESKLHLIVLTSDVANTSIKSDSLCSYIGN